MPCTTWIFIGPEIGERKNAVQKTLSSLQKQYDTIEIHRLYAHETDISQALALLQSGTLFSSARVVVFFGAETIKKQADVNALLAWINAKHNTKDAFLILVSDETRIAKKLESAVPASNKRIFWELFENQKHNWIRSFFANRNMHINEDGITTILQLVENNTDALKTTCSQIELFLAPKSHIDGKDIEQLLTHNREETPFSLFNMLTYKNTEQALLILHTLLLSKNSSCIQIIAGLQYCFRRLQDWHTAHTQGTPSEFDLKRIGFTAAKARQQYQRACKIWNAKQTKIVIHLLNEADNKIRQSQSALHTLLLEYTILKIATL